MVNAFIALGSNMGNRKENLTKALQFLGENCTILKTSSIYETEPMYVKDQNWFLNCVCKVNTESSPDSLLGLAKSIEHKMGRKESEVRFGPRIIDIDILFYGDQIISKSGLEIPHPRIHERLFVLVPLAEIESDLVHPVKMKQISELLAELHSGERIIKL